MALYICVGCGSIIHCDFLTLKPCPFGPCMSDLCLRVLGELDDDQASICEECHREKTKLSVSVGIRHKIILAIENRIFSELHLMARKVDVYDCNIDCSRSSENYRALQSIHTRCAKNAIKRLRGINKKIRLK